MSDDAQPNADVDRDDAAGERLMRQILWHYIVPELQKRAEQERYQQPVGLTKMQVVLFSDGRETEVRINDEVHPDYDSNCGHITFIQIGPDTWYGAVNRKYDAQHAAELIAKARESLIAAERARDADSWAPFVVYLYSAIEDAVKAEAVTAAFAGDVKYRMGHPVIGEPFQTWASWGNVEPFIAATFDILVALQTRVRNVHERPGPQWKHAEMWFREAAALLARAEATVERRRAPPSG
jgi:hypothetical protein